MKKKMVRAGALLLIGLLVLSLTGCNGANYKKALELTEQGKYAEALPIFEKLGDYEDAPAKAAYARLQLSTLEKNFWFFESDADNAVNVLSFKDGKACIGQIYYDGNGKHVVEDKVCEYTADDSKISITLADGSTKEVLYELDEQNVSLGNEYFTAQQIDDGLQGYWGLKESTYIPYVGFTSSENIYQYDKGTVRFESANRSGIHNDGTYFYTPVKTGTYTVEKEGLKVDATNVFQFGFTISEGKVVANRCGDILKSYEGFKGENGYSFN